MRSDIITNICIDGNGCAIDHAGHYFCTVTDMLNQYEVSICTFKNRLRRKTGLEYALTGGIQKERVIKDTAIKVLGEYYPSYEKIAKVFNVSPTSVATHRDNLNAYVLSLDCYVYNGVKYRSLDDLSIACGVPEPTLRRRLKVGWSFDEATTEACKNSGSKKSVKDHKGNTYECLFDMLSAYGITTRCYYARKSRGWSLEKILTTPRHNKPSKK